MLFEHFWTAIAATENQSALWWGVYGVLMGFGLFVVAIIGLVGGKND